MIEKTTNNRAQMHERIERALAAKNMLPKAQSLSELNNFLNANPHVKKLTKGRPESKLDNKTKMIEKARSKNNYETASRFLKTNGNFYVTFGGVGDLVLLLAECYKDEEAKIIFFANNCSNKFGEQFLKYFKMKFLAVPNLMGSKWANMFIKEAELTGKLKTSAHLARDLNYEDWRINTEEYENRIVSQTTWLDQIGTITHDRPVVLIAPTGSQRDAGRQRYMLTDEYLALAHVFLKRNMTVYSIGSEADLVRYPLIDNKNHFWLNSEKIIDCKKGIKEINFTKFLQTINSASEVISMDTWLKTYTCLIGIKTHVILNRRPDKYIEYGTDVSDYIFLNKKIWHTMELWKIDDLIEYAKN